MKKSLIAVVTLTTLVSCHSSESTPEPILAPTEVEVEASVDPSYPSDSMVPSEDDAIMDAGVSEGAEVDSMRRKVLDRLLQEKTMNQGLDTTKSNQ